jgi:hypothetical protein
MRIEKFKRYKSPGYDQIPKVLKTDDTSKMGKLHFAKKVQYYKILEIFQV